MAQPLRQSDSPTAPTADELDGWLSVEEAARSLRKSHRTVQVMCGDGRLAAKRVSTPAGAAWRIDPTCRAELRIAAGDTVAPALTLAGADLAGLPGKHREILHQRVQMIEAYLAYMDDKPLGWTIARCQKAFVEGWVAGCGADGDDTTLAPRSLRRHIAAYRSGGMAGLIDRRARNGRGSTICAELKEIILGLYARQERPTVAYIYELATAIARREGWEIPSMRAVQLWISKSDRKLLDAGRDPKRHRDRDVPHIVRDWTHVAAMECIVGDHHQFDFFWPRLVWDNRRGRCVWKWFRPWLSGWLDARSWYMYSHSIAFDSPDGDRVMGSFLKGVMAHGAPGLVYLDNGKDYRMYRFAGGRAKPSRKGDKVVAQRHVEPILEMFGVGVTWAIPYNARAKIIEPYFKIVEARFGRRFETYCGNKPERRPERIKKISGKAEMFAGRLFPEATLAKLAGLAEKGDQSQRDELCLTPLRGLFGEWLTGEYHLRKSPAKAAAGLTPAEAFVQFRAADFQARKPAEQDLALLLMPAKSVTVRQNGVWVAHFGCFYWSDDLEDRRCNGRGMRVTYRFNPDDPSRIYVFDGTTDRFLAVAAPYIGYGLHPLATHGTADAARVSDAIALQRRIGRDQRGAVRTAHKRAAAALAETGLTAQRQAADDLGLLAEPTATVETPAAVLKLAGELSRATAAGSDHQAAAVRRRSAEEFLADAEIPAATGTDDRSADDAGGGFDPYQLLPDGSHTKGTDPHDSGSPKPCTGAD